MAKQNHIGRGMDEMMALTGDAGLVFALSEMKASSVRTIMRPAIRAGASIGAKEAKRLAPEDDKNLIRSIGVQVKTNKSKGVVYGKIYVRRGFAKGAGKMNDPYFYGLLVEFGTAMRTQKGTGRRVGSMKPRPFMRPALSNKRAQIQSVIRSRTAASLRSVARRAAAKGKTL